MALDIKKRRVEASPCMIPVIGVSKGVCLLVEEFSVVALFDPGQGWSVSLSNASFV